MIARRAEASAEGSAASPSAGKHALSRFRALALASAKELHFDVASDDGDQSDEDAMDKVWRVTTGVVSLLCDGRVARTPPHPPAALLLPRINHVQAALDSNSDLSSSGR
jgi:hypothetical protein